MADFATERRPAETIDRRARDTTELTTFLMGLLNEQRAPRSLVATIVHLLEVGGYLAFEQPMTPADERRLIEVIRGGGFQIKPLRRDA